MTESKIQCDRCEAMAEVMRYVSDASELAAVGMVQGLDGPAEPYYLTKCPNCGMRAVDKISA